MHPEVLAPRRSYRTEVTMMVACVLGALALCALAACGIWCPSS